MIVPVFVPKRGYTEELEQIKAEVKQIKDNMPRKSSFQEELGRLQDEVMQKESIIKSQANFINRLISLNEELVGYINNIEEIKNSGGVRIGFETRQDLTCRKTLNFKTITIPQVNIGILEEQQ